MALNALRRIRLKKVGNLAQNCWLQYTESHQNIPNVYREPAILSGYRIPDKPWLYYAVSIFHVHNETINTWTHIVATLIFINKILHIVNMNETQNDCGHLPLVAFCICAATSSFLSGMAHTFHSKSPFCHYICFQLDYAGVGFYTFGQCVLFLYISCPNDIYDNYMNVVSLPVNVILSLLVMFGGSTAKLLYSRQYPFKRRLLQLGSGCIQAIFTSIPLVSRLVYCINKNEWSCRNTHHYSWMVSMVVFLFFFASHLPDRMAPGKFDLVGQSHQLFHIFQTLTALLQFDAAQQDLKNNVHSIWSCHFVSGYSLLLAMFSYALGCVVIILFLLKFVRIRIQDNKKCT